MPTPPAKSEIHTAIERLNVAKDRLGGAISELAARLSPLIRQEPSSGETGVNPPLTSAQLPQAIESEAMDLERLSERVERIIHYLAL